MTKRQLQEAKRIAARHGKATLHRLGDSPVALRIEGQFGPTWFVLAPEGQVVHSLREAAGNHAWAHHEESSRP
jgi:hypothetical protein